MRRVLHQYYSPSPREFDRLWEKGLLVPDTNVLLNLFRFMPAGAGEVMATFRSFEDRLWLPYQVGFEFQTLWRAEGQEQFSKLRSHLAAGRETILKAIRPLRPYADWPGKAIPRIDKFFAELDSELEQVVSEFPDPDDVYAEITELFDGKVGEPPFDKDRERRVAEHGRRRTSKVPPGYKDERPGDYLIWTELMEKAKRDERPVLFLTDDNKEDWWLRISGRTIGPRPELRAEFKRETSQEFYAYTATHFLELVRQRNEALVSSKTIQTMASAEQARQIGNMAKANFLQQLQIAEAVTKASVVTGVDAQRLIAMALGIRETKRLMGARKVTLALDGRSATGDPEFDALAGILARHELTAVQTIGAAQDARGIDNLDQGWRNFLDLVDLLSVDYLESVHDYVAQISRFGAEPTIVDIDQIPDVDPGSS